VTVGILGDASCCPAGEDSGSDKQEGMQTEAKEAAGEETFRQGATMD